MRKVTLLIMILMTYSCSHDHKLINRINNLENRVVLLENNKGQLVETPKFEQINKKNEVLRSSYNGLFIKAWIYNGMKPDKIRKPPYTMPYFKEIDRDGRFAFDALAKFNATKDYYKNIKNHTIGIEWSGYLRIDKTQNYSMTVEVLKSPVPRGNGWSYIVYSKFLIDDNEVNVGSTSLRGGVELSKPKSITLKLRKGKHRFKLWIGQYIYKHPASMGMYNFNADSVSFKLKIRGKDWPKNVSLTKNSFTIKK